MVKYFNYDCDTGKGGHPMELLSIVVPCWNEEAGLARFYAETAADRKSVCRERV